jgi:hypothetical protein
MSFVTRGCEHSPEGTLTQNTWETIPENMVPDVFDNVPIADHALVIKRVDNLETPQTLDVLFSETLKVSCVS